MNELIDKIIDFCSENYEMIAGAGGILLAVIIAGIFISNRVKAAKSDKPRDFFLEGEYDEMIREAARERKKEEIPVSEPASEEEAAVEETAAEEEVAEETAAEETNRGDNQPEEELALEDLMTEEEYQPVHININIERGQVKIGYDEDGRITCMVESEETAAAEAEESADTVVAAETAGSAECDEKSQMPAGIVLEKINLIKAAPARRFGPENFNTGRSGRIFTEEELQQQIKD